MKLLALYDFLAFLNGKYGMMLVVTSVLVAVVTYILGQISDRISINELFTNIISVVTLLFALAFIVFASYRHVKLKEYDYFALFTSSSVVFALLTLFIVVVRSAESSDTFQAYQLVLPIIASIMAGAIFSGMARLAQKVYFS